MAVWECHDLPAAEGGKPVRERFLPYSRQCLVESDIQAVIRVLKSDYLTTGPAVAEFEEVVASYVGSTYAVAFSSGTAALHAACYAAGIGSGDEVITTPLTFVATANAVLYVGGKPVFADIDPKTCQLDPSAVESLITEQTKAILPVDFAGHPVDHEAIRRIARVHHLMVIEDAAHALGAAYHNKKIGSMSEMTMFSFHPVKPVTTGEGGVITTDNADLARQMRQFRNHGITRDHALWRKDGDPWYYEMHFLGMNYKMTDIQAALGISQMKRLEVLNRRRRNIAARYDAAFQDLEPLKRPRISENATSSWHLYVVRLVPQRLTVSRQVIFEALRAENIGVNVHYIPVYWHPFYQSLGYPQGLCPEAEQCYEQLLTLPLFPSMTDKDVDDVIRGVRKVIHYYASV